MDKGRRKSGAEPAPAILTVIPEWADTAAIGMLVGLSERQIQNLTRSGVLTRETPPGRKVQKYRTCQAVQQYIAHVKQRTVGPGHSRELALRKLEAEVKLKESQSQLAAIKADIAGGRYIEAERAAGELARFLDAFKRFAMNIPGRVAGTAAGYAGADAARAMEKAVRRELEELLARFADAALLDGGEGAEEE